MRINQINTNNAGIPILARIHRLTSIRILYALVALYILSLCQLYSRQRSATFGVVSELKTVRGARGILAADFNGDGIPDLATFSNNQVYLHFQENDTVRWRTVPVRFDVQIVDIVAAHCDNDRLSDLVMITEHPSEIQVYLGKTDDKFSFRWKAPLNQTFENVVVGDINNDGKVDILLFGKKEPGITAFLGNNNGTFGAPVTILSDYTFSTVAVEDFNEDGINDVLAVNWISNEVLLFSGFGKMKFSNPSVLSFEDEPTEVATAFIDSGFTKDLVVGFSEKKEIQTFAGDGFGGFTHLQTIPLESVPSQIGVADFNADGKQDIVLFSQERKCIEVLLNNGMGGYADRSLFAAGKSPEEFTIFTDEYKSFPDIAIVDNDRSHLRLLQNSAVRVVRAKQMSYCLGLQPTGILVADVNSDGWPDILVGNSGSQSISLLTNYGDGTFEGQISFPTSFNVSSLLYCLRNDTLSKVLATDIKQDKVSITDLSAKDLSHLSYALTASFEPDILLATLGKNNAFLTIFDLDHGELPRDVSLMKFQQISQTRFVEQSFSIHPNGPAIAASIGDFDGDGILDVAYLSLNKKLKKIEAYESKGTAATEFITPRLAFRLEGQDTVSAFLWSADLNNDGIQDLVMLLREPVNLLYTSLGRRDTTLAAPQTDTNYVVNVLSKDRLKFFDVNGDGKIDIILDNSLTKTIQVYFGNGDGTFSAPVRLMNSEGLGGFAIEDINKDDIPELIVTDTGNGVLKIVSIE